MWGKLWISKNQWTATRSNKCWRCRCYSCRICNSVSVYYTWNVYQVLWVVVDSNSKKHTKEQHRYRFILSKGSKNLRCFKRRTTENIWIWCEAVTGRSYQRLRVFTSRQSHVRRPYEGGILSISRSQETVLLGLNCCFRQYCRSAPGIHGGGTHGICRYDSHGPKVK